MVFLISFTFQSTFPPNDVIYVRIYIPTYFLLNQTKAESASLLNQRDFCSCFMVNVILCLLNYFVNLTY